MLIKGNSYECCSACSHNVTSAYESDGWEFVKKALNEKGYVEELSGLAAVSSPYPKPYEPHCVEITQMVNLVQVQRAAEKAMAEVEWSDDGSGEEGEGELI